MRPATGSKDTIALSHPGGIDKRDTLRPCGHRQRMEIGGALEPTGSVGRGEKASVSSPDHASCAWEIRASASSQEEAGGTPPPEQWKTQH